jgi:hypothetical protein
MCVTKFIKIANVGWTFAEESHTCYMLRDLSLEVMMFTKLLKG